MTEDRLLLRLWSPPSWGASEPKPRAPAFADRAWLHPGIDRDHCPGSVTVRGCSTCVPRYARCGSRRWSIRRSTRMSPAGSR